MKHFLIALCFISGSVLAQECKYDGSQIEMNECAKRDYWKADEALNVAYKTAIGEQTIGEQEILREKQRAWVVRRDARCNPKRAEKHSNATIEYFTCMQTLTEIRTLQLNSGR